MQKSIDSQQAVLHKLCSGIDKLANASTTAAAEAAGAAVATVTATKNLAAAASSTAEAAASAKEAAEASVEALLQRRVSPQDSVARAVLEGALRSVSSGTS
jgi:predicted RNase H-like HicB family nuclease